MSDERVTVTVKDGIADVRLNRPEKLNALDHPMFAALSEASAALAARDGVRAVVLSGNGRAFSAGIDLSALGGGDGTPDPGAERAHGIANFYQQAVWGWRELPVPVIAAVHGVAFGGGLQVALAADIRIAAPGARLSVMEARWGLVPDMAGIALLRGLLRDDVARELTYTARELTGTEAAALGLVTRTAGDPHAQAMELAERVAGNSPRAVRGAKRLFALSQDTGAAEILLAEAAEQVPLLGGPDQLELLAAQAEGRAPRFTD
jgi:enoyl-CoA hydratase/carnithine racemase